MIVDNVKKHFNVDLSHEGAKNVAQTMLADYVKRDKQERERATGNNPLALATDDLLRWTSEFAIRVEEVEKQNKEQYVDPINSLQSDESSIAPSDISNEQKISATLHERQ
ncbi:hypothetical protein RUND412_010456, partial [Rhizina undulata]